MTYGKLLVAGGIALIVIGILTLLIGAAAIAAKKKKVKERLYDQYGL